MEPLNIALLQLSPAGTVAGNLEKGLAACRRARALGADIALFPEMWSSGYNICGRPPEVWKREAVPAGGDFVRAFQALAAELACGSITDQELEQLEKTHRAFVDACDRNDGAGAIDHDNLFHETIVRAARNEYVEEFSRTMILHIQRIKYHYFHCDRMRKISVSQHGEILRTIQARDGAKAKELMRSHWICSMENSLRDIAGSMQGHGGELGADVLTK